MRKRVVVGENKVQGETWAGMYLIDWCVAHPASGLGGATGKSPVGVWERVWGALKKERRDDRAAVVGQKVVFLDEYVGAFPSYHHWAWRNLRLSGEGFKPHYVSVPRGCFFNEHDCLVNSDYLDTVLDDAGGEWEECTEVGEDGRRPEIRIKADTTHPVLRQIRSSMAGYDGLVRAQNQRLQMLGVGVGGAIQKNPMAGGHIGFVECGAAAKGTSVMLVRLAQSTQAANASDFSLCDSDGDDVSLEPACFAVTQGISTILSAGELLMLAWGRKKRLAVERMLLGTPGPQNPAAWVQEHLNVTIVLDREAFGNLDAAALRERGFEVEFLVASPVVS